MKSTRHQVAKQIKRARRVGITGELEEQLRQCPEIRDTNKKWDRFATKTAEHITTAQRELGARIRRKEKMNIKEKKRLNKSKNNRKLGNFLRYAIKRKGPTPMATTLVEYTTEGPKTIDKPKLIKKNILN